MARRRILVAAALFALASLAFLAYASRAPNERYAFDRAARDLRRLDRTLNQDVLRARFQLINTFDPLVATSHRMRELRQELHAPPTYLSDEDRVALDVAVTEYEDALDRKDEMIERFKTVSSVLKNSLRYLPSLAMGLGDDLDESPATVGTGREVRRLLELVLVHNLTSDDGYRPRVERQIALLDGMSSDLSESDRSRLASVLAHARVVLRTKPEVDALLVQIFDVPTDRLEERLQVAYAQGHAHAAARAARFRVALFALSAILLGLVVFAFVRLGTALSSLAGANATLESKVEQRTRAIAAEAERTQHALDELQRAQIELVQAQKLVSIGQLAAGVAHEINTPIQYVGDNTRFLQGAVGTLLGLVDAQCEALGAETTTMPSETREALAKLKKKAKIDYLRREAPSAIEQSLEGLSRVAHIVGAMKSFSHPSGGDMMPVDLREAFESTITVSHNEWKYAATVDLVVDEDLGPVSCLRDELNQVLLNLIVNAAHAVVDRERPAGTLGKIGVHVAKVDGFAEIRVSDDGTGIPVELRTRIFDPFFTTKAVGKGTGQGLAIAYNVVVGKHKGSIAVESEVGRGSTFVIRIPLQAPAAVLGELHEAA